jgi:hypothetical protein
MRMLTTYCNVRPAIVAFEHPDLVLLLLAGIIPSILRPVMQFYGLAHIMRKDEGGNAILVKNAGITARQRVIVNKTREWPPDAVKVSFEACFT